MPIQARKASGGNVTRKRTGNAESGLDGGNCNLSTRQQSRRWVQGQGTSGRDRPGEAPPTLEPVSQEFRTHTSFVDNVFR